MHSDLSYILLDWQIQDLAFRELAFFVLCLAAGGENLSLIDHRHVKQPHDDATCIGMPTSDLSESEADLELATCLGLGYHLDGLPMGSAPEETNLSCFSWHENIALHDSLGPRNHPILKDFYEERKQVYTVDTKLY